jgi:peptide deformylase
MAIRRIYETPDAVLRQISKPVETFDEELKTLIADMFETMYDAPGIGLAAVQVGEPMDMECADSTAWVKDGRAWKCALHTETILEQA